MDFMKKLRSRKLIAAVVGVVAVFLDLTPEQQSMIVTMLVSYIGAQGVSDFAASWGSKKGSQGD